ncbi:MAG: outer membrane protein assembly factor BamD [Pseudomonadota bacterium]
MGPTKMRLVEQSNDQSRTRNHLAARRRGGAGPLRLGVALVFAAALVAGCAGNKDDELPYVEQPVETLYNNALDEMSRGRYFNSARLFDEVERQHPYSVWARRAILMSAFSNYQANQYDEAILASDRFITLYPGNEDVAYAHYLKALSYYEQITDVGRDQKITEEATQALRTTIERFPESDYARDARLKLELTLDHLAGKEMEIGRYYLNRGHYVAAINRFQNVISNFQTTSHTPEALHRLTEAYLALGVTDEAQATAAVLGFNYPGNEWYQDSYALLTGEDLRPAEKPSSWIANAWKSVF